MKLQNVSSNQIWTIQCPRSDSNETPVTVLQSTNTKLPELQQRECIDNARIIDFAKTHFIRSGGPDDNLVIEHDRLWLPGALNDPLNGSIPFLSCIVTTAIGLKIFEGSAQPDLSTLDYDLFTFPISHLGATVLMTNEKLPERGHESTTAGEILKFIGIMVLMT